MKKLYYIFIISMIVFTVVGLRIARDQSRDKVSEGQPQGISVLPTPRQAPTRPGAPVTKPVLEPTVAPKPVREFAGGYYAILNNYRAQRGLYALSRNVQLEASANARAYRIATGIDSWSHDGALAFINSYYGKVNPGMGENLGRGYYDFNEVMAAWDASPTHKYNLVHSYCEVGIGYYNGYWVQHFGIDYQVGC